MLRKEKQLQKAYIFLCWTLHVNTVKQCSPTYIFFSCRSERLLTEKDYSKSKKHVFQKNNNQETHAFYLRGVKFTQCQTERILYQS